jgi:hypothetical protein
MNEHSMAAAETDPIVYRYSRLARTALRGTTSLTAAVRSATARPDICSILDISSYLRATA